MSGQPDMDQPEFRDPGATITHDCGFSRSHPLACLTLTLSRRATAAIWGCILYRVCPHSRAGADCSGRLLKDRFDSVARLRHLGRSRLVISPPGFAARTPGPVSVYGLWVNCS